jgi:peptidyl-prolyl cis-trans isomerase D
MGFLAIAFVGWMVFDVGMGITGAGSYRLGDAVAKVNGRAIELDGYFNAIREAQERQRQRFGTAPLTREDQTALENAVLESMIQQVLLEEEFRRRGIRVTDDEILGAAQTSPPPEVMQAEPFQTDGQFDLAKYQRYLASRQDPGFLQALEARYRDEIPRAKLFEQLVADVYLSDAKLWQAYRDQHDSVLAQLLALAPSLIPDTAVQVTEAEIKAHYDRNRDALERPGVAYLSYVAISRLPNAADTAAALERARRIRREIAAGADFAEVARRESSDSVSAAKGGDLGEVSQGTFVNEFERAALALRPGQVSQPVLSPFGYHIIRLESRRGDSFHARHILIPIELAGDHLARVDAQVDSLDRYAAEQTDPTALDSTAAMLGLPVLVAPPLPQGERLVIPPQTVPDAGIWAFEAQPGETSPVIEADHAFYGFRLDSVVPGGVPPLAEVREQVRGAVVETKKREALRQLADRLAKDLAAGEPLERVAERIGAPLRLVGPFTRANPAPELLDEPAVVGAAFGLEAGEIGGPTSGRQNMYFVRTVAKHLADSAGFVPQLPTQRAQALQVARQARVRLVLNSLRESARVVDRRRDLERAQREAEERAAQLPQPVGF